MSKKFIISTSRKIILWSLLTVPAAVSFPASSAFGCYAVVVGREASADNSVLLGHNEENSSEGCFLNFRKIPRITHKPGEFVTLHQGGRIPQVNQTNAFLWSENPGLSFSDGYLNEWGIAVVSDGCPARERNRKKFHAKGQLYQGGIGYLLRRLVIERAKTAREGIQIASELINQFGYPGSRILIIADPTEAWLFSIGGGKNWVARRVPDDEVVVVPNVHIIGQIDLKDKANFLASDGLVDYAVLQGWYDPAGEKPFLFYRAYAPSRNPLMDRRQWWGQCLVTETKISPQPDRYLPFSVKPARKLSVKDVIGILRNHTVKGICSASLQESAVFQLRRQMPPAIGCIYWRASSEGCTSVLTPWYVGITETPEEYYKPVELDQQLTLEYHFERSAAKFAFDKNLAWWTFKKLQDQVRQN